MVETYVNESDELIRLSINGEEIVTTPTHPFYNPQKGWTSAAKLRAGDILVLLNGEYAILEQIQHELLESPIQVYNFQVEDFHTYYVGNTGVLVHNACSPKEVGSYLIKDSNDKVVYVGKGSVERMNLSMRIRGGTSGIYYPAASKEIALANEAYYMSVYGGAKSVNIETILMNAINSPGLRYLFEWF